MWTSLPTALMAILLLSAPASARRHRKRTVTVEAWEATSTAGATALSASSGVLLEKANAANPVSVSTVTVIPMPVGTIDGVYYPGIATGTGIRPGVFYTGYGTGAGSGTARPTGGLSHHTGTGNHTHHHSAQPPKVNSTSSSVPFFTLEATTPIATPTSPPSTTSAIAPTTSTVSSITSTTSSTLSSSTSSPKPSSTSTSAAPSPPASTSIPFLRGVNLGGWLVLEKWMNDDVFTGAFSGASDQYSFDSISGAAAALEQHWSTFFTESDIVDIAKTGINALRIPIGYWAYDNSGTPYIKGADVYLEKAIGWARNSGMKVWVDCHGSPGSQNGFDNSGQAGNVAWQQGDNMDKSIDILKTMAKKYGAMEYADVVVGLQMVNEPVSWGNNNFETTQSWTQKAYSAVKAEVENEGLVIVMHDGFQGGTAWTAVATDILDGGARTFGVDQHLYQLFTDQYNAMDQSQHITAACGWAANLAIANAIMPNYVGEWSAATNICVNPDGSTTAGTSCSTSGCQCQVEDFSKWNENMIEQVRRFVEAQLDVFESSTSGYFIWAAKGPGGWGFLNGIGNGAIPNPVTERKYPNQCGGGLKRREVRGSLGAKAEAW